MPGAGAVPGTGILNRVALGLAASASVALAVLCGWRVVATTMADDLATEDPQAALRWQPGHPAALMALAERQLAAGDPQAAAANARRLARIEPLQGRAFAIVARASEAAADPDAATRLHAIASRRAPRVLRSHAWLADRDLRAGRYGEALAQIDIILRLSPRDGAYLLPLLSQWSANPTFAQALASRLRDNPGWRPAMLQTLSSNSDGPAANAVYAALREQDALSVAETGGWLDALIHAGRWGQAYSHWASGLATAGGGALPAVHNGGFEFAVSGIGFDWRIGTAPGALTEIGSMPGAGGTKAAHVSFRGRPAAGGNLEQALLLGPGPHLLRLRMQAQSLRSDQGLQWALSCEDELQPFATGPEIQGSFDWREFRLAFEVPTAGCDGQWLRLTNPAPPGSARTVSGDLWVDDVAIQVVVAADPPGAGEVTALHRY